MAGKERIGKRAGEYSKHLHDQSFIFRESLRGSRKLLLLENCKSNGRKELSGCKNDAHSNCTVIETGYANNAYIAGDTFCDSTSMNESEPIPLEQVMISMNRVAEHLEKREGREEESKLLRDFFTQKPVQQAIESNVIVHMKNNKVLFYSIYHLTLNVT
ncbi:hypothetical protein LOAG_12627 [Loa loa]|uniref:Uncharacterized protein n=1 Tax=Loa loa TaxID=7209 RepID=A0A1S0TKU7_LOALO|nr:hypothetical protein LOAG_12627 [Loa loa]EFO15882.2 hypothetical protein LOAG_12627 [Loa loa]